MTYGDMAGQYRDTDIYELLLPKPEEKAEAGVVELPVESVEAARA